MTKCSACHIDEARDPAVPHAEAYASRILAPYVGDVTDLAVVEAANANCDPAAEPERCAMLDALFGHGEVRPMSFAEW